MHLINQTSLRIDKIDDYYLLETHRVHLKYFSLSTVSIKSVPQVGLIAIINRLPFLI